MSGYKFSVELSVEAVEDILNNSGDITNYVIDALKVDLEKQIRNFLKEKNENKSTKK